MILLSPLKSKDLPFLKQSATLYSSDFRAASESLAYTIPAMWKYENLLLWILDNQLVAVNDHYAEIQYPHTNNCVTAPRPEDARTPVLSRLQWDSLPYIQSLWAAVPHPDTDTLARQHNLILNYSYEAFLKKNDKIQQKKLLGTTTPPWKEIQNTTELEHALGEKKTGFVKRQHGSGGYAIFPINQLNRSSEFQALVKQGGKWFFEALVSGIPFSIQCVRFAHEDRIVIFGYTKQHIAEGKHFTGSSLLPLSTLSDTILRQLKQGIQQLQPLLEDYEGFFGIDFIAAEDEKVHILEANIRMTVATIPTLLFNLTGCTQAEFREDIPEDKIETTAVVFTKDMTNKTADILLFSPSHDKLGTSFFLDLKECTGIPKD